MIGKPNDQIDAEEEYLMHQADLDKKRAAKEAQDKKLWLRHDYYALSEKIDPQTALDAGQRDHGTVTFR